MPSVVWEKLIVFKEGMVTVLIGGHCQCPWKSHVYIKYSAFHRETDWANEIRHIFSRTVYSLVMKYYSLWKSTPYCIKYRKF